MFLLVFVSTCLVAQKHTISGYVSDAQTGEKLIGASIYDPKALNGTTTNAYGFFSITLPADSVTIVFSFVGYTKKALSLNLTQDVSLNIELSPSIELKTFEVTATQVEKIEQRTQMSAVEIPMKQIEIIPALLGERDILKVVQLLPGVQSGGEGTSGFYVRGGGPDQNLILLDGVPVYNASHLFGFFSVFNPDAINHVELTKGGFPARYGGRLSSVLDIRMKEGNLKEWHGSGSVGIVASKLTLEGPIWKDRTSFIVSGRRTYIDILAQPFIRRQAQQTGEDIRAGYYFYDVNAKINHKFSDKSRLYLSAYLGNDQAYADFESEYRYNDIVNQSRSESRLGWGNITSALRWNKVLSNKVFSNTTLTYSRYQFNVGEFSQDVTTEPDTSYTSTFDYTYLSGIEDFTAKVDFDILPNPNHYIRVGLGDIYHTFTPGVNAFQSDGISSDILDTTFGAQPVYAHEVFAYAEDDIRFGARLKANVGLHYSGFISGKTHYHSLQPRVSARYLLSDNLSVKASYAQMAQFIHLLTNGTIGLPTDLWVPSTDKVKPQNSHQIAIGLAKTIKDFEVSVEGYYKTMQNLIEYKEGASYFSFAANWDDQIEFGQGTSYGGEFFIQKKAGIITGWVGYTLSWTNRQFDNLNFGEPFPYRYDRRHDISIVLVGQLSENVDVGVTWVYGTGNAVTLATTQYLANTSYNPFQFGGGQFLPTVSYFESRNDFRMPSYHRLDVGFNFKKEKKWGERTWSIGTYNSYNRQNPFYLFFEDQGDRTVLKQVSLFPIIPYVAYSFKF